jgi:menaquinone-dependent protoporphyrinogen IX oxidase
LILIGGPVWAWNVSPAIRTYLDKNADALKIKKVAFFATQSSDGSDKKFESMKKVLGMTPLAALTINGKDFRSDVHEKKIAQFIEDIRLVK